MTSTALVVTKPQLTQDVWQMIQQVAPTMKDSRLFGVATTEQAAAVMLKGHELGLSLTASFEFIHVIDNKPTLSPRGALALIYQSPLCDGVEIKDETDDKGIPVACTVTMKRKGGLTYTSRFTMEDAKRAGLVKSNGGWEKYPSLMLKWRAIGYCADVVFPDLLNGAKRADEFDADLTPSGEVIEGSWNNVGSQQTPPTPVSTVSQTKPPYNPLRLNELLEEFGAAAIMEANSGKIPSSNEELDIVATKLGAE